MKLEKQVPVICLHSVMESCRQENGSIFYYKPLYTISYDKMLKF